MLVLGVESSCDETACAIVRDGKEVLSNVVLSQHHVQISLLLHSSSTLPRLIKHFRNGE